MSFARKSLLVFVSLLTAVILAACSKPAPEHKIPPQMWNDVVVEIQTRPIPPRVGMNEFLILTTLERGKPVRDLLVSVRTDPRGKWHQAIQDGHSGVHRRAANVPASPAVLEVKLERKRSDEEGVLMFEIPVEPS